MIRKKRVVLPIERYDDLRKRIFEVLNEYKTVGKKWNIKDLWADVNVGYEDREKVGYGHVRKALMMIQKKYHGPDYWPKKDSGRFLDIPAQAESTPQNTMQLGSNTQAKYDMGLEKDIDLAVQLLLSATSILRKLIS